MKSSINEIKNRREKIIDLLFSSEKGSKSVKSLATYFNISEMTIRRDLKYLEEVGLIQRFHGGALLVEDINTKNPNNSIYIERIKAEIAKNAANYVENNSTIYINSGSTALNVVDYLSDLSLVIVSNNPSLYQKETNPNTTSIITGGEVRSPKDVLVGDLAINALSDIHADIAVISCSGVSAEKGISTNNLHEARINKVMIDNAYKLVVLVADHRKIGNDTNFIVTDLTKVDLLITDIYSDTDAIRKIEDLGVRVIQVEI